MGIYLSIKCWYQGFYEYGCFYSRIVVWRSAPRPTRKTVSLCINPYPANVENMVSS